MAMVAVATRSLLWTVCSGDTHVLHVGWYRTPPHHPKLCKTDRAEPIQTLGGQPTLRLTISGDQLGWRHPVAAAISGLPADRVHEILFAIAEVVANARKHAGDPAQLALWIASDGVVCEVHDDGPGVDDLFAGDLPPGSKDASKGTGIWIAGNSAIPSHPLWTDRDHRAARDQRLSS